MCDFYSVQVANLGRKGLDVLERVTVDAVDGLQGFEFDSVVQAYSLTGGKPGWCSWPLAGSGPHEL